MQTKYPNKISKQNIHTKYPNEISEQNIQTKYPNKISKGQRAYLGQT